MQETYLRAWRSFDGFEGRASIRSWLYKIATNPCLSALEPRRIRMLPSGLAGPSDGTDRPPTQRASGEVSWLEPFPDQWITAEANDPATIVVARESLRLAIIASLQHLPGRQRAIFLLREVLSFSAAETADILDTTTAAVKSGLQRARAQLEELEPDPETLLEPTDNGHARCSTATSQPSRAPTPPFWNTSCARTRRSRRLRSATGRLGGTAASAYSTGT